MVPSAPMASPNQPNMLTSRTTTPMVAAATTRTMAMIVSRVRILLLSLVPGSALADGAATAGCPETARTVAPALERPVAAGSDRTPWEVVVVMDARAVVKAPANGTPGQLLCPFDLQMWAVDRMLNFEITDDPHYQGLELQVFDDPAHGRGMIVLYLGTLSSAIIALALTAQLSGLGVAFQAFALVLLPVVFFLGVVTHGRLLQVNAEWRLYGQGMNRIRHYFLELAPEMERYFVLSATDDPWVTLAAIGVQTGGNPWWQALLTAGSMVVVVNSVLAGVVAGLLWRSVAGPSGPLPLALAAAVGFLLSLVSQGIYGQRAFRRDLEASSVVFPTGPAGSRDR